MIRQVLPYDRKPSGKESIKRLRAYIGSPKELNHEKIQFEKAKLKNLHQTTTMGELCRVIGWTE